jgi:hypothetical protein
VKIFKKFNLIKDYLIAWFRLHNSRDKTITLKEMKKLLKRKVGK